MDSSNDKLSILVCGEGRYKTGISFYKQTAVYSSKLSSRTWIAQDLSHYDDKVHTTCSSSKQKKVVASTKRRLLREREPQKGRLLQTLECETDPCDYSLYTPEEVYQILPATILAKSM